MNDHDALKINNIKAALESVLGDMQIETPATDEHDQQAWAFVVFKLAAARDALNEAVEKAGAHSTEPIPMNINTAQEVANALAFALLGGNPNVEPHPEAQFN